MSEFYLRVWSGADCLICEGGGFFTWGCNEDMYRLVAAVERYLKP